MKSVTCLRKSLGAIDLKVLVTGVSGYIGSHIALGLIQSGHEVIGIDTAPSSNDFLNFFLIDIRYTDAVIELVKNANIDVIVNLAAKKSVKESFDEPLEYFEVNTHAIERIVARLEGTRVHKVIHASSAAIYGNQQSVYADESMTPNPLSPYAESKILSENVLKYWGAQNQISIYSLRFFNVLGSSTSKLRDNSVGSLLPGILNEIRHGRPAIVFGNKYPTLDGSCVRDFVHVLDVTRTVTELCNRSESRPSSIILNIGSGQGHTVIEVINEVFNSLSLRTNYIIEAPRPGDIPAIIADINYAKSAIDYRPSYNLRDMIESSL